MKKKKKKKKKNSRLEDTHLRHNGTQYLGAGVVPAVGGVGVVQRNVRQRRVADEAERQEAGEQVGRRPAQHQPAHARARRHGRRQRRHGPALVVAEPAQLQLHPLDGRAVGAQQVREPAHRAPRERAARVGQAHRRWQHRAETSDAQRGQDHVIASTVGACVDGGRSVREVSPITVFAGIGVVLFDGRLVQYDVLIERHAVCRCVIVAVVEFVTIVSHNLAVARVIVASIATFGDVIDKGAFVHALQRQAEVIERSLFNCSP